MPHAFLRFSIPSLLSAPLPVHRIINTGMATGLICLAWFLARAKLAPLSQNDSLNTIDILCGLLALFSGVVAILCSALLLCEKKTNSIRWWQWLYLATVGIYLVSFLGSAALIVFG